VVLNFKNILIKENVVGKTDETDYREKTVGRGRYNT
jgi:hypothetical protein